MEAADIGRAYELFVDIKWSTHFMMEYQEQYIFNKVHQMKRIGVIMQQGSPDESLELTMLAAPVHVMNVQCVNPLSGQIHFQTRLFGYLTLKGWVHRMQASIDTDAVRKGLVVMLIPCAALTAEIDAIVMTYIRNRPPERRSGQPLPCMFAWTS